MIDRLDQLENYVQVDSSYWDKHFILAVDLDLGSIPNWSPIGNCGPDNVCGAGSDDAPFSGTFRGLSPYGQPVRLSNLQINRPTAQGIGFFGKIEGATIANIGLENVAVEGYQYVGGLVGVNNNGADIENSYVTGAVMGNNSVGGLVGGNFGGTIGGTIEKSYATGTVTGAGDYVGGLVGRHYSDYGGVFVVIINSYATGAVEGSQKVGGLVGENNLRATIENSYATGAVEGTGAAVGGLVGDNDHGTIENSYATGAVSGTGTVGGLVGWNSGSGSTIEKSYATGAVTGNEDVGGLVGGNDADIEKSYATGAVSGTGSNIGGLVGQNNHGTDIENSYATGAVEGSQKVGGLVGGNDADIENSYATGAVSGSSGVGGLVGWNSGSGSGSTIENSYATGAVSGSSGVGGLVGWNNSGADIEKSYATGAVTGDNSVGGLVGTDEDTGTIENSYATGAVSGTGSNIGGFVGWNDDVDGDIQGINYFVDSEGGDNGIGMGVCAGTCTRAATDLQVIFDALFGAMGWTVSEWQDRGNAHPCIATIDFGRGACPP